MRAHLNALRAFYGLLPSPPGEVFAFAVWELLSAHVLPARRDLAWQALKRLPALTPDSLFRASTKEIREAVAPAGGSADERVDRLRAVAGEIRRHRPRYERLGDGLFPAARAIWRLPHLSAVVRARALLFAADQPVLAVDEGVARVVMRLAGTMRPGEPARLRVRRARRHLATHVPVDLELRRDLALYLPYHAARACTETAPHCAVCPLRPECAGATGAGTSS